MNNNKLMIIVLKVKNKYLKCDDVELKKYVGKVMAGDIRIKEVKNENKSISDI